MNRPPQCDSMRPRELALLLLASGDLVPRARPRDQQADTAGLALKRRVLERLAVLDPPGETIEAALAGIVEEIGEPSGPTRGVASSIMDDWRASQMAPEFLNWLTGRAVRGTAREDERRGPAIRH